VHADPNLPVESFTFYACKCIVPLGIGFERKYRSIRMVYPSLLSLLPLL
jgi:hypothetical protein